MHGVALHVAKSLWLQYSHALSFVTFHKASILMFPIQHMFCHYGSHPNSQAERIMSSKKLERVSVEAALPSELPTSRCNMDPPLLYTQTRTCMWTPTQLPRPTAEKWRNPSCVSCQLKTSPIKAWDCQYPASIVEISQLALCQHFPATGNCSVKSNFFFITSRRFFYFYCRELLSNTIVPHFFHTLNKCVVMTDKGITSLI